MISKQGALLGPSHGRNQKSSQRLPSVGRRKEKILKPKLSSVGQTVEDSPIPTAHQNTLDKSCPKQAQSAAIPKILPIYYVIYDIDITNMFIVQKIHGV